VIPLKLMFILFTYPAWKILMVAADFDLLPAGFASFLRKLA